MLIQKRYLLKYWVSKEKIAHSFSIYVFFSSLTADAMHNVIKNWSNFFLLMRCFVKFSYAFHQIFVRKKSVWIKWKVLIRDIWLAVFFSTFHLFKFIKPSSLFLFPFKLLNSSKILSCFWFSWFKNIDGLLLFVNFLFFNFFITKSRVIKTWIIKIGIWYIRRLKLWIWKVLAIII